MAKDRLPPVALFRAAALRPLLDYVDRWHGGTPRVFGAALGTLSDPDAVLPLAAGGHAFELAARALGLPDVGVRVGESTRVEQVGAFGALVRSALTVGGAFEAAVRNGSRFNTGQRFSLVQRGDEAWLHHTFASALDCGRRQASDFTLLLALQLVRVGAGPAWRPLEIRFEGPPPPHAERLAELAERRVHFHSTSTVVVLPRRVLALRLPPPDSSPSKAATPVPTLPARDALSSLEQMVESLLRLGSAHIEAAADAAGTSVRSFQRRLAACDLQFGELLQRARCRAAFRLLGDRSLKIVEISAALGYGDSANFTRAFRRWTGVSPQQFRRFAAELPVGDIRHAGLG